MFRSICDMEGHVLAASELAHAVMYLAEGVEDMYGAALARLARNIVDELARVEAARIEIFEAAHATLTLGQRYAALTAEGDNG